MSSLLADGASEGTRLTAKEKALVRSAHQQIGHVAPNTFAGALEAGVFDNIPVGLTGALVKRVNSKGSQCVVCEAARRTREPICSPNIVGSWFSFDRIGPVHIPGSVHDGIAFGLYVCLASGCPIIHLLPPGASQLDTSLRSLLELNKSRKHVLQGFRVDAGPMEKGQQFRATLAPWCNI